MNKKKFKNFPILKDSNLKIKLSKYIKLIFELFYQKMERYHTQKMVRNQYHLDYSV